MYPLKYLSAHPVIAPSKQIALFVLHGYRVKAEPQKIEASVRVTTLSEGYVPVTCCMGRPTASWRQCAGCIAVA